MWRWLAGGVLAGLILINWVVSVVARYAPPGWAYLLMIGCLWSLAFAWLGYRRHIDKRRLDLQYKIEQDRWRRVASVQLEWLWICPRCSQPCVSYPDITRHCDQEESPCARLRDYLDKQEAAAVETLPMGGFSASFQGQGGADTWADEKLESPPADPERAATWRRIAELARQNARRLA